MCSELIESTLAILCNDFNPDPQRKEAGRPDFNRHSRLEGCSVKARDRLYGELHQVSPQRSWLHGANTVWTTVGSEYPVNTQHTASSPTAVCADKSLGAGSIGVITTKRLRSPLLRRYPGRRPSHGWLHPRQI